MHDQQCHIGLGKHTFRVIETYRRQGIAARLSHRMVGETNYCHL
jgi:hypothetical protein